MLSLVLLLLTLTTYAAGPIYRHQEAEKQLEFENVYQDIRSVTRSTTTLISGSTNYIQNSSTLQSGATVYVTTGTIQNFTATSASFTSVTVSNTLQGAGTLSLTSGTLTNFTAVSSSITLAKIVTFSNSPAMGSNKFTGLSAGNAAGDSVRYEQLLFQPGISVSTKTSQFTTTSSTFMVTGHTVTVTPRSTSSGFSIMATGTLENGASGQITFLTLGKNGINMGGTNGMTLHSFTTTTTDGAAAVLWVDYPATTSATSYQVMIRSTGGSTGGWCAASSSCLMTVTEITGL